MKTTSDNCFRDVSIATGSSERVCLVTDAGSKKNGTDLAPVRGEWIDDYTLDPITGMVAFPSFFSTFPRLLVRLLRSYSGVGLAIGDVDNLKTYVESSNRSNPLMFGHLAGNAFMAKLGSISLSVFDTMPHPWRCVSTFGGDEIILVCAGGLRSQFSSNVRLLSMTLATQLPRTVSFALGWFAVSPDDGLLTIEDNEASFLCTGCISMVDRALLAGKHWRRKNCTKQTPLIVPLRTRWLKEKQWQLNRLRLRTTKTREGHRNDHDYDKTVCST